MRAAVLLNPFAGGAGRIRETANAVRAFLSDYEILVTEPFGGALLPGSRLVQIDADLPYVERLYAAADALSAMEPAFFVIAGGDGMAAYVAGRLLQTGQVRPKLLGVAMGTANVGPIISMDAAALLRLRPEQIEYLDCGAIEVSDGEEPVAYAFNDAVLGNTLLSTVDGCVCTVSARALAQSGKLLPVAPATDIGPVTVIKNDQPMGSALPHVSQIIVSPVERENLFGRAVTGMLCFTAGRPERAAMLLTERPLVMLAPDERGYTSLAACEQLLFSECDCVQVVGLGPDMQIVADGNPYIRVSDTVSFRYRPGLIRAARAR